MRVWRVLAVVAGAMVCVGLASSSVRAQDMFDHVDLDSPAMRDAEMTRAEVEVVLAAGAGADFEGKMLSGLDLTNLDFSGANMRTARLNGTDLSGSNLSGAKIDQAWMLGTKLDGADLRGASLFSTQLIGCSAKDADFSEARIVGRLDNCDLTGARFDSAHMGADMTNQSMGLMRASLRSATADGASFVDTNLARADAEFLSLKGASLRGANLSGSMLSGADFRGADVSGATLTGADVHSADLREIGGLDEATGADKLKNLNEAFR